MRKVGVVVDKGADAFDMMTILPTFQYASGRLRISVNPDLKPYLLELKRGESTSYRLEIIRAMKSEYAIKLFEYFKNVYSQPGSRADFYEFEPVQFRERFLDKKGYRSKNYIGDIESRVIIPAIDEINAYSDLSMTYAKVRRGRGVLFVFTVEKKDTPWWVRAEKTAAKKGLPRSSDVAQLRADPRRYLIEKLKIKTSMAKELFENLIVEISENGTIVIQGESVFLRRLRELHEDDLSIIAKPHPIEYIDFADLPL
jgi:plasmid replication initiation protein